MEKICLDCAIPVKGRADKKFCSDQCRNNYNNQLNSNTNNYLRNVNNILRKNRRILSQFCSNLKAKIHKEKLSDKGFNFSYFTNTYKTQKGNIYYFCYEHGYLPLEDHRYALVVRKEYVGK